MSEFFPNIPEIKFEGKDSRNPLAFKYYDAKKVIMGKTMEDHLNFAMAWWHNLCANGFDMFYAFISGMDAFALGLIKAAQIIEDGRIDGFVKERYASYSDGIGKKIRNRSITLEEAAAYAAELKKPASPGSGRQEYLETVLNNILFS